MTSKIDSRAIVSRDVDIGDNCFISAGAVLCSGVKLGNDVRIGPNAVFVAPESLSKNEPTRVNSGVKIGANSTIYPGVNIGLNSIVLPGTVVTRSIPPGAIVEGNPALITGYVDTEKKTVLSSAGIDERNQIENTNVTGVTVHHFPIIQDLRGDLTVGEFDKQIPFTPLRYFLVFGVPRREIRGEHAHFKCHQFLICVKGSCSVVADDGARRVEIHLDGPNKGLYLPPMIWGIQYKYSSDAILLVFASHHYDPADYIRNYNDFLVLKRTIEDVAF